MLMHGSGLFQIFFFLIDLFRSLIFSRSKEEDRNIKVVVFCPTRSLSTKDKNKTLTDLGGILFFKSAGQVLIWKIKKTKEEKVST